MAEVLGIFASSVQVAGLAGQIAGVGLKIRALYEEVQDAPEDLAFRLEELHLLADILSQSHTTSPDVANFCERCLSELSLVLLELEAQIKKSKGIRQKMASTKIVLKKQLIQKLENRLCRSVQLLQLAANSNMVSSYGLILQNQDCMMSLLKTYFSEAKEPDAAMSSAIPRPDFADPRRLKSRGGKHRIKNCYNVIQDDSNMWSLVQSLDGMPGWSRTFGLTFVTGTLQVESKDSQRQDHDCPGPDCMGLNCPTMNRFSTFQIRLALPRWLSNKVLEVTAQRSRIGWKQYIRVRNVFPRLDNTPGTPLHLACDDIASGELQSLRTRIVNREVTPWDEDGRGETMWTTAIYFARWDICNYLMDLGAEPSPRLPIHNESKSVLVEDFVAVSPSWAGRTSEVKQAMQAERRRLIDRLDDENGLKFTLLSGLEGTLNEFECLRSSIWPNELFYHRDFSQQRMQFAISIACSGGVGAMAPSMIRSILGLNDASLHPVLDFSVSNSFKKTIFHGLACQTATSTGSQSSEEWHRLACEILTHVTDVEDLNRVSIPIYKAPCRSIAQTTAFTTLISECIIMETEISPNPLSICIKTLRAVTSSCETSIMAWLRKLHKSGIDLVEYGRNEQKSHRRSETTDDVVQVRLLSIGVHWMGAWDPEICDKTALVGGLRLINFQYGKVPQDWRFWWNEPSDGFAGDFWRLVEFEITTVAMSVPGAWID